MIIQNHKWKITAPNTYQWVVGISNFEFGSIWILRM